MQVSVLLEYIFFLAKWQQNKERWFHWVFLPFSYLSPYFFLLLRSSLSVIFHRDFQITWPFKCFWQSDILLLRGLLLSYKKLILSDRSGEPWKHSDDSRRLVHSVSCFYNEKTETRSAGGFVSVPSLTGGRAGRGMTLICHSVLPTTQSMVLSEAFLFLHSELFLKKFLSFCVPFVF